MQKIILPIVFLAAVLAGVYWYFLYPPNALKRAADKSLQELAKAVESKDRERIGGVLQGALTDDAKIKLEVNFFSIATQKPAMVQEFDKAGFIKFVDNILYSMTDYGYEPQIKLFDLSDDKQSAAVEFVSREWSDGNNYYNRSPILTRFSSNTTCKGQAAIVGAKPILKQVECSMQLRSVPKPDELQKMKPEMLNDFLMKN